MERFYEGLALRRDEPLADVFAEAQRHIFLHATSAAFFHPRFWAPFVVLGDGSTIVMSLTSHDSFWQGSTRKVEHDGFEFIGAASVAHSNQIVVSKIGPTENNHHPATLETRDQNGVVRWQHTLLTDGAGPVARDGKHIAWGTYEYFTLSHVTAHVTLFSSDGDELWAATIPNHKPVETIADISIDSKGRVVVLTTGTTLINTPRQLVRLVDEFRIVVFDSSGHIIANRLIGTGDFSMTAGITRRAVLAVSRSGEYVVALNEGRKIVMDPGFTFDEFRSPSNCWSRSAARVEIVDQDSLMPIREMAYPDLQINKVHSSADGYVIAGKLADSCELQGRAALLQLDANLAVHPLWRDAGPFDSNLVDAFPTPHGFLAIANSERQISLDLDQTQHRIATTNLTEERPDWEYLHKSEWSMVEISGDRIAVHYSDAGLSTTIDAAVSLDNELILVGVVGWSALWMSMPNDTAKTPN
jgi:hypothetical protein